MKLDGLAAFVTTTWTRLYTLGLPAHVSRARRLEVESDLWEQRHDTDATASARSILARTIAGMPDDLSWRLFLAARIAAASGLSLERGRAMSRAPQTGIITTGAITAWSLSCFLALSPQTASLAMAGALLALIALAGWALELRNEHEDSATTDRSAAPALLAVAVATIAAGLVLDGGRLGLVVSVPMALALSAGAASRIVSNRPSAGPPTLPAHQIQARISAGDALAIETLARRRVDRRGLLRGTAWLGLGSVLAMAGGVVVDFLWQRNVSGFGGVVTPGTIDQFPPGSRRHVTAGKFWLVHLTTDQGGPGFLALWQKCPHLGCAVAWEPGYSFADATTGERREGWFRCPCHSSTYDDAGVRVYGPAPRSMDRMKLTITPEGLIQVDTSRIEKGTTDNAAFAVQPPPSVA